MATFTKRIGRIGPRCAIGEYKYCPSTWSGARRGERSFTDPKLAKRTVIYLYLTVLEKYPPFFSPTGRASSSRCRWGFTDPNSSSAVTVGPNKLGRAGGNFQNDVLSREVPMAPGRWLAGDGRHPRRDKRCYPTISFAPDFQNKTTF